MNSIILFLKSSVVAGTPLLFATLGEIMTERSGNLNLGVEGMMLMGAVLGFSGGLYTGSPYAAVLSGAFGGLIGALIFAFLTIQLKANQVVCGLSLSIFGSGFASFVGKGLTGKMVPAPLKAFFKPVNVPLLSNIPFIGRIFFSQDIYIYFGYILSVLLGVYLYKTRPGLNLRATGESPAASDAAGINIELYKYVHTLLGGALCGLGGAYLSLVYVPIWQENITAGRGWIAVALVIFAGWNPYRAMIGAFLFGGLDIIGFRLQGTSLAVNQYLVDMLPYLATVIILVVISLKKSRDNTPPDALGNSYFREER